MWRNCNVATIDFAKKVPESEWREKPFEKRFKNFAWEFACLTRTRMCYLNALRTGKINFGKQDGMPEKEILALETKSKTLEELAQLAREILEQIEKSKVENKVELLAWLLQHERIHQGKFILYFAQKGWKMPKSFVKTWGESNFKKK